MFEGGQGFSKLGGEGGADALQRQAGQQLRADRARRRHDQEAGTGRVGVVGPGRTGELQQHPHAGPEQERIALDFQHIVKTRAQASLTSAFAGGSKQSEGDAPQLGALFDGSTEGKAITLEHHACTEDDPGWSVPDDGQGFGHAGGPLKTKAQVGQLGLDALLLGRILQDHQDVRAAARSGDAASGSGPGLDAIPAQALGFVKALIRFQRQFHGRLIALGHQASDAHAERDRRSHGRIRMGNGNGCQPRRDALRHGFGTLQIRL